MDPSDADQQVFTEPGAWEFIAELLEGGHSIQEIKLDNPEGKTGYVLLASGGEKRPEIYVKLHSAVARSSGAAFITANPTRARGNAHDSGL